MTGDVGTAKLLGLGELPLAAESPREFGEELRRERELRDVTRDQLAAATRISVRQVEALETGRFEILPAKVFSRGFVRAIALHLGLDPDNYAAAFGSVWDDWVMAESSRVTHEVTHSGQHIRLSKPRRAVKASTVVVGVGVALLFGLVTAGAALLRGRSNSPKPSSKPKAEQLSFPASGPASLALPPAIAAATFALPPATLLPPNLPVREKPAAAQEAGTPPLPSGSSGNPGSSPTPGSSENPANSANVARSVASTVSAGPAMPTSGPMAVDAPASRGGLTLTLAFRDDCWTEVQADGRPAAAELFRKGSKREFSGAAKYTLTLGNSGAVAVSLNGAPISIDAGPAKVVKNLVIDGAAARARR